MQLPFAGSAAASARRKRCAELVGARMKTRVLQVYRTYFPDTQGGTEEVIRTLAQGLCPERFELVVLYPSRHVRHVEEIDVDGVRVCRVPETFEIASCNVFLRGLAAFRRWAKWADVIHYHYPWPFADLLHLLLARGMGRHTVLTYHADIVRQRRLARLYAPLMKRFLGSMDMIVATSDNYARSSAVLANFAARVRVIPIGLDPARVPAAEPALIEAWRQRVGDGFFFFVGVLRYYKGLDVLLDAVAGTSLRVVIAGDGPERARLEAQASRPGSGSVVFAGRISDADKWALFALSRAFVFPSNQRSEAYGVALLEAMACGKPMITADIGTGVNFVNDAPRTGLNVAADDAHALREAMLRLASDESLCQQLGCAARERLERMLSARHMVSAYAGLYRELCRDPSQ
jgi:glycosyltransferase involved in cell wall biosynthesis